MNFQAPIITNRKELLRHISEEEIMHHYTGVRPDTTGAFPSPFRRDRNPSASFYYKNGRLKLLDFAGYFNGDCFDVVAKCIGLGDTSTGHFDTVLNEIVNTLLRHKRVRTVYQMDGVKEKQTFKSIEFEYRPFTEYDKQYWYGRFNFDFPWRYMENLLLKAGIYSARKVWIEGRLWRVATEEQPMYVYRVRKEKGDGCYLKVYRPYSDKRFKWRNNTPSSVVHGLGLLDFKKPSIRNKSLKDVVYGHIFGINSYAYQGEFMTTELLPNTVGILGDNDFAGKRALVKFRKEHPDITIYKFPDSTAKDFTDQLLERGQKNMKTFLKDFL